MDRLEEFWYNNRSNADTLASICKQLSLFTPKIKKAVDEGKDLFPADKQKLKILNEAFSEIMKDLNDDFKKLPK